MSRIASALARLAQRNELAFVTYHTLGFPDLPTSEDLVLAAVEGGADLVELGIPFSDPIADGPTIQRAGYHAIQAGVTVRSCLSAAARLRARADVPFVFMTYYNLVHHHGPERFVAATAEAGVDGLIMVDLPPEEAVELRALLRPHALDLIPLLAPTSTDERIRIGVTEGSGFVYCVSVTGVTGARGALAAGLPEFLARVRRHTSLPLAVGFGISRPEHVRQLHSLADAVVVGSALVTTIEHATPEQRVQAVRDYVRAMKDATRRV